MNSNAPEIQAVTAVNAIQPSPRVDLYAGIHKALRALMADTLLAVGRMDPDDADELAAVGQQAVALFDFCAAHLTHENNFVHTAMEARAPGASALIAHEHEEHLAHIGHMQAAVTALCASAGQPGAAAAALDFSRKLALFIAENFQHMHVEETAHNAVLWARYTDAELIAIHGALVASIPPAEMAYTLRWLLPYMNPGERAAMLADMQAHAPAPVFLGALEIARPHLTAAEWAKLSRSLGLAPVPGLVV